jgi:hypothetical protein
VMINQLSRPTIEKFQNFNNKENNNNFNKISHPIILYIHIYPFSHHFPAMNN